MCTIVVSVHGSKMDITQIAYCRSKSHQVLIMSPKFLGNSAPILVDCGKAIDIETIVDLDHGKNQVNFDRIFFFFHFLF